MSKKANPTLIGAFVVGAIVLLAIGVSLFGGAQLFARKSNAVAYFESSVKGLRVGSNVLFRGVRVGFVSDITLMGEVKTLQPMVRTTLELTPGVWALYRDGKRISEDAADMISSERLVDAGLRARLGVESFVTGQLVVELDFLPDTKPVFRAFAGEHESEIPTVPSNVQQVLDKARAFVEQIDFERLQKNLQGALEGLNELANNKDAREALAGLNRFANSQDMQQLPARLDATLTELRGAVQDFSRLAENLDAEIDPLGTELKTGLQNLNEAVLAAKSTLESLDRQIRGDGGLESDVTSTLTEIRAAARSLRTLTTYLEEHPEALLRGKRER